MVDFFEPSSVDWCEPNYEYLSFVAEIANTATSTVFIFLPPLLGFLNRKYAQIINPSINVIWVMLMIVGFCGAYHHATLNLLGQILEELSTFWLVMAAFLVFLPLQAIPKRFFGSRKRFAWAIGSIGVLISAASVQFPIFTTSALVMLGFLLTTELITALEQTRSKRARRLAMTFVVVLVLSVCCWILDRGFCKTWKAVNFPYLHCIWHILIFASFYMGCVLFAYFDVKAKSIGKNQVIKYWPRDSEPGIPYVTVD